MVGSRALLCLVAFANMAAASGPASGPSHSGSGYSGPTPKSFSELQYLVDALEASLNSDIEAFSDAATLLAAGDELIDLIDDRRLPSINVINAQQDSLLELGRTQIKALEHRADEALSLATQTLTVAQGSGVALDEQNSDIQREQDINMNQSSSIQTLNATIQEWQADILNSIDNERAFLTSLENAASTRIEELQDFVDSKICEYGEIVTTAIGENQVVLFKVPFAEIPSVSLTTIGFRGQLDVHSYDQYDQVSLDRHVTDVTTDGFYVSAQDLSAGMVEVDTIYSAYMACQNLAVDVSLTNTTVTRPTTTKFGK